MNVEPIVLELTSADLTVRVTEQPLGLLLEVDVPAGHHADVAIDRSALHRVAVRIHDVRPVELLASAGAGPEADR